MRQATKLLLFCLLGSLFIISGQEEGTCEAGDGKTCKANDTSHEASSQKVHKTRSMRFFSETSYCTSNGGDLYSNGGSAQAYLKSAAISSTVCSQRVSDEYSHKVSSWPLTRHNQGTKAPSMDITLHLWSCKPKDEDVSACACSPLAETSSVVQVWQALPSGDYSSLRDSDQSVCRATVPVTDQGDVTFSTVAPGSSGIMSGLGPFDFAPYGPPVIHIFIEAARHDSLLIDLPVLHHSKTLEQRSFSLSGFDWRGAAWSKKGRKTPPYKITSWNADVENNRIGMEVNVFLGSVTGHDEEDRGLVSEFCSSWYFLPASFFLQPIAVCGKYLLDFFPL